MTTTQFNTLVQMIATLSDRTEKIAQDQKNFITKVDAKNFATKEDLKHELKNYATKDDLAEMANTILEAIQYPFASLEKLTSNHEKRLNVLEEKSPQKSTKIEGCTAATQPT